MEVRQIYYVLEIAKQHNFSKAADALFITQPTISHQVKALENELGVKLFDRDTHGVRLTKDGERFCKYGQTVTDSLDMLLREFDQSAPVSRPTIRIGVYQFYKTTELSSIISKFFTQNDSVVGGTHVTDNYESYEMLLNGRLDYSILKLRPANKKNEFEYTELASNNLTVLISADRPEASKKVFALDELDGLPLITGEKDTHYYIEMKELYDENDLDFNVTFFSDDSDIVMGMVASGTGVNLATAEVGQNISDPGIVSIPIEPPQKIVTYLIRAKKKRPTAVDLAFKNFIISSFQSIS
jgi:DNA-binding transcriptional LysR family regulator